jgi:hypothetical protein
LFSIVIAELLSCDIPAVPDPDQLLLLPEAVAALLPLGSVEPVVCQLFCADAFPEAAVVFEPVADELFIDPVTFPAVIVESDMVPADVVGMADTSPEAALIVPASLMLPEAVPEVLTLVPEPAPVLVLEHAAINPTASSAVVACFNVFIGFSFWLLNGMSIELMQKIFRGAYGRRSRTVQRFHIGRLPEASRGSPVPVRLYLESSTWRCAPVCR